MIENWVEPQHLTKSSIDEYRKLFVDHDVPALRISNFLKPDVAEGLYEFCKNDANWTVKSLSLRKQAKVSEEVWNNAAEEDRFYSMWNLNPDQIAKKGSGLNLFKHLMSDLRNDQSMAGWFASISGLPLIKGASVSAKAFAANDFLGPHNDRTSDRRLAFIFYLSKDWDPSFGGGLYMRKEGNEEVFFEYEYNSLVIFDVLKKQKHWIDPIKPACGDKMRYSIGGWFSESEKKGDHEQ